MIRWLSIVFLSDPTIRPIPDQKGYAINSTRHAAAQEGWRTPLCIQKSGSGGAGFG